MSAAADISLQQAQQLLGISATLSSTTIPNNLETKPSATHHTTSSSMPQASGQNMNCANSAHQKPKSNAPRSGSKRKSLQDYESSPSSPTSAGSKKRRRRANPPKEQAANKSVPPADPIIPEIESLNIDAEVEARLVQRRRKPRRSRSSIRRSLTNGETSNTVSNVNGEGLTMSNPGKRKRAPRSNGTATDEESMEKTKGSSPTEESTIGIDSYKRRKTRRSGVGQETAVKSDTLSGETGAKSTAEGNAAAGIELDIKNAMTAKRRRTLKV